MLSSPVQYSHDEVRGENDGYPDIPVSEAGQGRIREAEMKGRPPLPSTLNKTHFSQSDVPHVSSKRSFGCCPECTMRARPLPLCASDLGIDTPRLRRIVSLIEDEEPDVIVQDRRLIDSVCRQLVFLRFGCALESRTRFLNYWFNEKRFKGKDVVSEGVFVNLALEQQEHLTVEARQYARNWHGRHPKIKALRAWAPHGLNLSGFSTEAKRRVVDIVSCREKDGSRGHDINRTLGAVYPLILSGHADPAMMLASLEYAALRIGRGFGDSPVAKASALKSLARLNCVPNEIVRELRQKVALQRGVFLSHTSADKPAVRRLAATFVQRASAFGSTRRRFMPATIL
jgi:hypothetical protein